MTVLVMCYTGMHPGELLGVDVATHLHTTDTLSYFRTGSKTNAGRSLHFNPLMVSLGIADCAPYTCRHSYANLQKRRQVDAELMM